MSERVSYQFLGPLKRADGFCTAACDHDVNGFCRVCGCLDPARFVVVEYPTREQDAARKWAELAARHGVSVYSLRPANSHPVTRP